MRASWGSTRSSWRGAEVGRGEASGTGSGQGLRILMRPRARDSAALRVLSRICPAGCFGFDAAERIAFAPEGCQWCGICRIVCAATGEIEWQGGGAGGAFA